MNEYYKINLEAYCLSCGTGANLPTYDTASKQSLRENIKNLKCPKCGSSKIMPRFRVLSLLNKFIQLTHTLTDFEKTIYLLQKMIEFLIEKADLSAKETKEFKEYCQMNEQVEASIEHKYRKKLTKEIISQYITIEQ